MFYPPTKTSFLTHSGTPSAPNASKWGMKLTTPATQWGVVLQCTSGSTEQLQTNPPQTLLIGLGRDKGDHEDQHDCVTNDQSRGKRLHPLRQHLVPVFLGHQSYYACTSGNAKQNWWMDTPKRIALFTVKAAASFTIGYCIAAGLQKPQEALVNTSLQLAYLFPSSLTGAASLLLPVICFTGYTALLCCGGFKVGYWIFKDRSKRR